MRERTDDGRRQQHGRLGLLDLGEAGSPASRAPQAAAPPPSSPSPADERLAAGGCKRFSEAYILQKRRGVGKGKDPGTPAVRAMTATREQCS